MTRPVRISVIGTESFALADSPDLDPVAAVSRYLDARFSEVLSDEPDFIVLGELSDLPADVARDWGDAVRHVGDRGDRILNHVARIAERHRTNIAYSSLIDVGAGVTNTTTIIDREGNTVAAYHKNYLLEVEREAGLLYGEVEEIATLDFGTVAPAICFDLNFPELRGRYAAAHPDVIAFSSAFHGSFLQQVWAYECGSYLASAIKSPSPSRVINPLGEVVASTTNYTHSLTVDVELDRVVVHLDHNVETLRKIKKELGRAVSIADPGFLGSVLLLSHGSVSARDIAAEFGLEPIDAYWRRSRAARDEYFQSPDRSD